MKCPKCGAYNKPEYKKCYVCGSVLPQEYIEEKHINNKKNMWTQSAFHDDEEIDVTNEQLESDKQEEQTRSRFVDISSIEEEAENHEKQKYSIYAKREQAKERGIWGDHKSTRYTRRGEGNIPVVALEDESENATGKKRRRGSKYAVEPLSENAKRIRYFREGQEIGVVVPPEPEIQEEEKKDNRPKKTVYKKKLSIKWGRLVLVSLFAVVVLFGLIVGIVSLTGKISESMSELFVPRNQLPNGGQPLVERVLKDGQTWHMITFYGEDGDKILVEDESHNLKRTLTVHGNTAVISLDDYSYIPKSSEEDYYGEEFTYVTLEAWHFDEDGEETKLEVPTYRISVAEAPLTVVYPTEQGLTVKETQVLVKVKVEPNSRVIIDTKNMSGNIDGEGYTSTYVNLDPTGMNNILITVEVDGYRVNNYNLQVYSPEQEVAIELTEPPTETQASELRIDGVTEPGATVTLDSSMPLLIDKIIVDKEGRFYLKTKLSDFGENPIILYATMPDGRSTTLIHVIHRLPLEGAYTSKAWVLDYKALSSSANKMIGQIYHLEGYLVERIDTAEAKLFMFNVNTAADPQYVILEYNGLYDIKMNWKYDIYADVLGKYENYPELYARFIYLSEDQNQNGIDDEEEGYDHEAELAGTGTN